MHLTEMGCCSKLMISLAVLSVFASMADAVSRSHEVPFDDVYWVVWGNDHVNLLNERRVAQLWMDNTSGAGFGSKVSYGSGFVHMNIKLPDRDSAGVVTAFYLITANSSNHDEVDFEFLGNREGKPITLQTNVFANGTGEREQRVLLWFDPSADFHNYKILWNPYHIVFYVDNIPIRVYKNKMDIGVPYPDQPMSVQASLWNGDWATDGGKTKIDWSHAPFTAHFQDFGFGGCPLSQDSKNVEECYDSKYWWNGSKYSELSNKELRELQEVRQKYMNYDYCDDKTRHPTTPPECAFNNQFRQ